jgi:isopenicillin-N N-acyltransferase-like protein
VREEATKFLSALENKHSRYVEEMRGVASGADVDFLDILALNVRTEITFGLFTGGDIPDEKISIDGCTAFSYVPGDGRNKGAFLGQNWDWQLEQLPNLFVCYIAQPDSEAPDIAMITEGGIIGKIGLNSRGVGVCLNAIRARGVDAPKLPIHLALRAALESPSAAQAALQLEDEGVAGSAHILVADGQSAVGLEATVKGIKRIGADDKGLIVHSNHLILEHPGVDEPMWLKDSPVRLDRMRKLMSKVVADSEPTLPSLAALLEDQEGYPSGINRQQLEGKDTIQTLFSITMDLKVAKAAVTFGRPTEPIDQVELAF